MGAAGWMGKVRCVHVSMTSTEPVGSATRGLGLMCFVGKPQL